jgi:queuine tRNA-ribosyltransferase
MSFKFEIIKKDTKSKARAGIIHTPHGPIETPVFMPVGTQATVKSLTPKVMKEDVHASILLSNTYHLSLRPGADVIETFGGLHSFMNWPHPILTDSGGYQVFSLSGQRKITPNGVQFKSHIDGSPQSFTPKRVIDLQCSFNSDIMMPLDICSPYPCSEDQLERDLEITHRWEQEARDYWATKHQNRWLFAIVQGGMNKRLRAKSASFLTNLDFPGYALGGLSVGEPPELLTEMISYSADLLP